MSQQPLLSIEKLSKIFRLKGQNYAAVDALSLQLFAGEVLSVVGESGSGKSTLARCVMGLQDKSNGDVHYRSQRLPSSYRRKDFLWQADKMQMVFQDSGSSLNPKMTVRELLKEPLTLLGRPVLMADLQAMLAAVNLPASCLERYPHEFSGGQRQRLGIARALISKPELLVCDEAVSALDVSVQAQVVNLLLSLKSQLGLTMLFIAHDLSVVRYISDRVAVMYRGQLMELADTETLFTNARHPYTQRLLAANPVADPNTILTPIRLVEITSSEGLAASNGCQFAPLCSLRQEVCWQERPQLQKQGDSQLACHAY